jgi:hypothetical protein
MHGLMGPLSVWAVAPGRPVSMAYAVVPRRAGERRPPLSITVAGRGADLRFEVVRDGRPVPGADVVIECSPYGPGEWSPASDLGAPDDRAMDPVRNAFTPNARSGPDGVARVRDIPPGQYRVRVLGSLDEADERRRQAGATDVVASSATAEGIAAVAGRETRYVIAIHPQPINHRLRIRRPDGSTPRDRLVVLGYERRIPKFLAPWSEVNDQGITSIQISEPGLWVVRARFRDSTSRAYTYTVGRIETEPFFEATAVVPYSPGVALPDPVELTAWRREPGSVRARLLDARGEPARGTILLLNPYGRGDSTRHAGTTDRKGEILFRDVLSGHFSAFGFVEGQPIPPDVVDTGTFPGLEELRRQQFVPEMPVETRAAEEATVTLRLRPAGYVRGVLRPRPGRDLSGYDVIAWRPEPMTPIGCRYEASTGRFVCGPLTQGTLQVAAAEQPAASDAVGNTAPRRVELPAGSVVAVDLAPPEASPELDVSLPGMGNGSVREAIAAMPAGSVERSGGGPAVGARALLFVPGQEGPTATGVTDASGRLTWGGVTTREGLSAPNPDRPTAIVWLPGESGAAFAEVRMGQAVRVTLPRPVSVTGRVTLGGGPFEGRNARVRVVAAFRGRGVFDRVLSAEAAVEADGRFSLHGITPGRYVLQAARDDIWLSRATELVVSPDVPSPEPVLDIAEPGEAVAVTVVDARGLPVAGLAISPVRPEGPLAGLWPAAFHTDASGTVVFRSLEEGTHRLLIDGRTVPQALRVGKAVRPAAPPVPVRITR